MMVSNLIKTSSKYSAIAIPVIKSLIFASLYGKGIMMVRGITWSSGGRKKMLGDEMNYGATTGAAQEEHKNLVKL